MLLGGKTQEVMGFSMGQGKRRVFSGVPGYEYFNRADFIKRGCQ